MAILGQKIAIQWRTWREMSQMVLYEMRIFSPVSLSYLDANFES